MNDQKGNVERTRSNQEIANALGVKLWKTDWFIPRYRSGEIGDWKIISGGQLVHDWGYYSEIRLVEMLPVLARKVQGDGGVSWETWMALTPHEIESQELACRYAYGKTVIMGLGMGWVAANTALNEGVAEVKVVERDRDVINLFKESGALDSLPGPARNKIEIIHDDALKWKPSGGESIDFLYADIWLRLAEIDTLDQVKQMQRNIRAKTVYYWGQELAIYQAFRESSTNLANAAVQTLKETIEKGIGLPLLVPMDLNYGLLIEKVIHNRIKRHLPTRIKLESS